MAAAPWWSWVWPALAWVALLAAKFMGIGGAFAVVPAVLLIATVFSAVYHAEVIAHRLGEPFGALVLAVAVTIIEVALIVSATAGDASKASLARDTVFAAVMIVCNGIIGACLLMGGARHHEQGFQVQGASAALAVLAALTTLTLVVPNFTTSVKGPMLSFPQLGFVATVSLVLYCAFLFVQTVRHREYFLSGEGGDDHADPTSNPNSIVSFLLLLVALTAVVGLAKVLTPSIDATVARLGVQPSVGGIIIAGLVLLPEGLAALNAARANHLQTSLNLALGSVLATIGLTIPAVAIVSIAIARPLELGLGQEEEVLLALTLLVGVITLGTGRTTVLQGIVHLVIFFAFLFFSIWP
jgi:Ca2+:H+ antiporter